MAHTPGPWEAVGDRDDEGIMIVQSATGGEVCDIVSTLGYAEADEANARLIAAAPDLLEALVDFVEQVEAYDRLHGANSCAISPDAARLAIAKAEGR